MGCKNNTLIVVDIKNKMIERVLQAGHCGRVTGLAHHPRMNVAATGDALGVVRLKRQPKFLLAPDPGTAIRSRLRGCPRGRALEGVAPRCQLLENGSGAGC